MEILVLVCREFNLCKGSLSESGMNLRWRCEQCGCLLTTETSNEAYHLKATYKSSVRFEGDVVIDLTIVVSKQLFC